MTNPPLKSIEIQSFCYPGSEQFDEITLELWADGDVRILSDEADIIIPLDDLADAVRDLINAKMVHNHEQMATIRKQIEALENE